jgi:DNA-binding HxlR family transcriptional regulator
LKRLTASGLLTRRPDPDHWQKGVYSLTEPTIELVPLLAHMTAWGRRHTQPQGGVVGAGGAARGGRLTVMERVHG